MYICRQRQFSSSTLPRPPLTAYAGRTSVARLARLRKAKKVYIYIVGKLTH